VKKAGSAGSGVAEGSSLVLVQPVVPLGSWTKYRDPYLICVCRLPLQINWRAWGGRPRVCGPLCAEEQSQGRRTQLLRSHYFCLLRHRLLEPRFRERSFVFIWVLSLTSSKVTSPTPIWKSLVLCLPKTNTQEESCSVICGQQPPPDLETCGVCE